MVRQNIPRDTCKACPHNEQLHMYIAKSPPGRHDRKKHGPLIITFLGRSHKYKYKCNCVMIERSRKHVLNIETMKSHWNSCQSMFPQIK